MKNNWFDEVFLPSLVERAKQNPPKYQDRVILSQKQYDVCLRNMSIKQCHGDYGDFTRFVYETDTHKFMTEQAGKYNFLYIWAK
jgi:hypothetical protein